MITVVNYGLGNIGSILNMFRYLDIPCEIASDLETIKNSSKLLLPGVGAFGHGMEELNKRNFTEVIKDKVHIEGTPILGICLGMQLLCNSSDENAGIKGLGLIDGEVKRFKPSKNYPVPHMGWNTVNIVNSNALTKNLNEGCRFYFVHSFFVSPSKLSDVSMITTYQHDFASMVANNNIFGAQFHPEKSHKHGMAFLKAFESL